MNSISRGRDLQSYRNSHRSAISAPPASDFQTQFRVIRRAHSESPSIATQFSLSPSLADSSSDPTDSMDTDEDHDDVDFWGGESPSGRVNSSPIGYMRKDQHKRGNHENDNPNKDNDYDNDDNDDDDNDEEYSDNEDNTDMSDDIEGDEIDRMEIFGHR